MKSFCNPKYVERYEDVVFDLETALNTTVVNNARQKKDGYRFVVDNSGEVTPFYWYNARISLGVRSIRKSGFRFWILDFGFPNKMRNPKMDFDQPKSFSKTDFN